MTAVTDKLVMVDGGDEMQNKWQQQPSIMLTLKFKPQHYCALRQSIHQLAVNEGDQSLQTAEHLRRCEL